MNSLPIGLDPIPYGYRRWNGRVWPDVHIDEYNARLADIGALHARATILACKWKSSIAVVSCSITSTNQTLAGRLPSR